ncbi:Predicted gene, 17660 [Apodemus speciosus]|uniref:Predicted gene, 17660 n=1 Tax=Apodemus speciosus TaxID=105296 RepID=A0ABQ0ESQ8_APOSI
MKLFLLAALLSAAASQPIPLGQSDGSSSEQIFLPATNPAVLSSVSPSAGSSDPDPFPFPFDPNQGSDTQSTSNVNHFYFEPTAGIPWGRCAQ